MKAYINYQLKKVYRKKQLDEQKQDKSEGLLTQQASPKVTQVNKENVQNETSKQSVLDDDSGVIVDSISSSKHEMYANSFASFLFDKINIKQVVLKKLLLTAIELGSLCVGDDHSVKLCVCYVKFLIVLLC